MKGIILAGGLGTRLRPCTLVTNKHLLPVYDRPMIYYPIQSLLNVGIKEIMIVTGGEFAGSFLRLLGNGKSFGMQHINYTYQEGEGGIAEALGLCEYYAGGDSVCVVLGDNLIEKNISKAVNRFKAEKEKGACVVLKEVPDPQRFGVVEFDAKGKISKVIEKPKNPPSNYAVTGFYMYDNRVFDIIKTLKPSDRGELEITDVNNKYLETGELHHEFLDGWWTDAGTIKSINRAHTMVAETGANKME